MTETYKDQALSDLVGNHGYNVAQFVSFSPDLSPRFSKIRGDKRDTLRPLSEAIKALLQKCASVNIRSFKENLNQGCEFIRELTDSKTIIGHVSRLGSSGFYTIINENIDVFDGGVSGVVDCPESGPAVIEFAPGDTPRCVEKPGCAQMDLRAGLPLLSTVYKGKLKFQRGCRIEFSAHPTPQGFLSENYVYWQKDLSGLQDQSPLFVSAWPNRFSRAVGDKAFGLYVASLLTDVPNTTVVSREIPTFSFGCRPFGSDSVWKRTCPKEPIPGKYSTTNKHCDIFRLMQTEGVSGDVASVILQDGVPSEWSGAAIATDDGVLIEGIRGVGESFMLGESDPEKLPPMVYESVKKVYAVLENAVGPVKFEWAYSMGLTYVLQLHVVSSRAPSNCIVRGDVDSEVVFDTTRGLEALRETLGSLPAGVGVVLKGRVGVTSRICDVLRKAGVPSRFEQNAIEEPNA